jgi:hypothetical protein
MVTTAGREATAVTGSTIASWRRPAKMATVVTNPRAKTGITVSSEMIGVELPISKKPALSVLRLLTELTAASASTASTVLPTATVSVVKKESGAATESTTGRGSIAAIEPTAVSESTVHTKESAQTIEPCAAIDTAVRFRSADLKTSDEQVLELKIELANERAAMANERAAMAIEREAIALKEADMAKRWASMCETRMKVMASDADRVTAFANETMRCQVLLRDAEWRVEAARQTATRMYSRICELAGGREEAQLQRNAVIELQEPTIVAQQLDVERMNEADYEAGEPVSTTDMHEAADGSAMKQQEVAATRRHEALVKMPAKGDAVVMKSMWNAPAKPCAERSTSRIKMTQRCMRCGGCDHAHGSCTSSKPTWGIDWSKHRERRRHGRRRRRPEKKTGTA